MTITDVTIHDVEQGSEAWWALRTGVPTVSSLSRIITPSRLGYSAGARGYASQLIGERILGEPLDKTGDSLWTDYGKEGEDYARGWYGWYYDVEVAQVGFLTRDVVNLDKDDKPIMDEGGEFVTSVFGGSPDGLIGGDGILEIKCPKATTHMNYLTRHKDLSGEYRLQVQGYLWLTGRKWCDLVSFNPDLPKKRVRVYPEEEAQAAIGACLARFYRDIDGAYRKIMALGDVIEDDEELRWELSASIDPEASDRAR